MAHAGWISAGEHRPTGQLWLAPSSLSVMLVREASWREGPRVEVEPPTDVLDGRAVLLPHDQHRQVLGIGQAKRLEDRR